MRTALDTVCGTYLKFANTACGSQSAISGPVPWYVCVLFSQCDAAFIILSPLFYLFFIWKAERERDLPYSCLLTKWLQHSCPNPGIRNFLLVQGPWPWAGSWLEVQQLGPESYGMLPLQVKTYLACFVTALAPALNILKKKRFLFER